MTFKSGIYFFCAFVLVMGCTNHYVPPVVSAGGSYLVVEGVINSSSDSTIIKLSKTVNLSGKSTVNPVLNAILTVESDQGAIYPLTAIGNGSYGSGGLNLDNTRKYRLRIQTADNKEYLSDFVPVVNAPPIDTVSYAIQGNGIQFNVSTHDPKNNTRYYRWDYRETWVIHSKYYSFYVSDGDSVVARNLATDQVYQCWQSDTSSTIVLGSSSTLIKDIINNNPLTFIPSTSAKLDGSQSIIVDQFAPTTNTYSIMVREYGLTSDAYQFWANLKKNTELTGSIFDSQPSISTGNIHSVNNNAEPVIGYISAGSYTSKRIFIANGQIPAAWLPDNTYSNCSLDTLYLNYLAPNSIVPVNQEDEYFNYNKDVKYFNQLIPIEVIINKLNAVVGHTGSTPECVDCTLKGTNHQPVFWK